MADNDIVSNSPSSSNTDIPVRTIDKGGQKIQVVTIDLGGAGAETLVSGTIPVSVAGVATETTLAALNTKVVAVDTGAVVVASSSLPSGASTSANQTTIIGYVDGIESALTTLNAKDFATQTTLSALNAKVTTCDTGAVVVSSSALPSGAASSANQTTMIGHLDGVEGLLTTIDSDTGNISTKIDTLAGAVSGTQMQVDVVSMPTTTVQGTVTANAGTSNGKTLTYVPVAQGAAGTTVLVAASPSNKHKIVGCFLTMSAAGTLKFTDGVGDLTGALDVAASGGFVLPTSSFPYQQTATNSALNLVTTIGLAKGVVIILTEA